MTMEPAQAEPIRLIKQILDTLEEQRSTIEGLRQQILSQNTRLEEQDKTIGNLQAQVEELSRKVDSKTPTPDEGDGRLELWNGNGAVKTSSSIAEAVKEAAEQELMKQLGFVFDSNTNLYCNYSTGYYYDSTQGLFYNGHTRTYYTYDADGRTFVFHSQLEDEEKVEKSPSKPKKKNIRSKNVSKSTAASEHGKADSARRDEDTEEGEVLSSSDSEGSEVYSAGTPSPASSTLSDKYPPCIRAIVTESPSHTLKVGSLFVITCTGGTIGRSGDRNDIILPDSSVDKIHADIKYTTTIGDGDECTDDDEDAPSKQYFITDLGSAHGTTLNGALLQPYVASELIHGSSIKIGDFSLLIHIHPGSFTCGHCEPGLLISPEQPVAVVYESKSRNALLKEVKKKYGLKKGPGQVTVDKSDKSSAYKDRARERRVTKGSDNPYEKTQVVSTQEPISQKNKGFAMLSKMGWSAGQGLGASNNKGLIEPINVLQRPSRSGLGVSLHNDVSSTLEASAPVNKDSKGVSSRKSELAAITLKRFNEVRQAEELDMDVDPKSENL